MCSTSLCSTVKVYIASWILKVYSKREAKLSITPLVYKRKAKLSIVPLVYKSYIHGNCTNC